MEQHTQPKPKPCTASRKPEARSPKPLALNPTPETHTSLVERHALLLAELDNTLVHTLEVVAGNLREQVMLHLESEAAKSVTNGQTDRHTDRHTNIRKHGIGDRRRSNLNPQPSTLNPQPLPGIGGRRRSSLRRLGGCPCLRRCCVSSSPAARRFGSTRP